MSNHNTVNQLAVEALSASEATLVKGGVMQDPVTGKTCTEPRTTTIFKVLFPSKTGPFLPRLF